MTDKNILIAIENGIIGLDIQRQLSGYGYNTEIIHLLNKENIKKKLSKHFQLMILEKCINDEGIEYAVRIAHENSLPVIYLSTDNDCRKHATEEQRILMMPFGEDDLRDTVRDVLGDC